MKKVFISYSSEDKAVVDRVTKAFTEHSISYWIDEENIKIGNNYAKAIADAIEECEVLCVFLSPHSNISRSVEAEINFAVMNNKKIISILLDNVELSPRIKYDIAFYQGIEIDWRKEDALDALINRITNKDSI